MLRAALVMVALLAAPLAAQPLTIPVGGTVTQAFGGYGSDGSEITIDLDVPPADVPNPVAFAIDFKGTVTQSLAFKFREDFYGGEDSFCTGTWAQPSFTLNLAAEELTSTEVETGVGTCGGIGETVSDTASALVSMSAVIDASNPYFADLLEGFPLALVFRDPNWWDLEGTSFDVYTYVTGFEGTLTIEAIGGAPDEVPEPAALGLLGLGLLGLGLRRRRG